MDDASVSSVWTDGGFRGSWVSDKTAQTVLAYTQVAYPIGLLLLYLAIFIYITIAYARASSRHAGEQEQQEAQHCKQLGPGGKPLPAKHQKKTDIPSYLEFSRPRKLLFQWISVAIILTLAANVATVIIHALVERDESWWCGQAATIYLIGGFMLHMLLVITLLDTVPSPNTAHLITWITAAILEIVLLACSFAIYTNAHREPKAGHPDGGHLQEAMTTWEILEVTADICRIFLLAALVAFYTLFVYLQGHKKKDTPGSGATSDDETTGLLAPNGANGQAAGSDSAPGSSHGYGAINGKPHAPREAPAGWEKPKELPSRSWWEYTRAYAIFVPYIWPYKNKMLQINFVVCIVIVFLQRLVQIAVPIQAGHITDILAGNDGPVYMPWGAISLYILYRLLQGSNGALGSVRQVLWIPIEQYSYRELSVAAFEHVHSLSLDFHLGKKTGEVLSALGKGASLNTFLENVTFNVLPMLVDLGVAMVVFLVRFDAYYALVVAIVTFWYIYITMRMASWRADIRRRATNASREEDAVKNDSMMSYETVKYFNAEAYEFNRYREAVQTFQKAEYLVTLSLSLLNTIQNLVFMLGLIVACFIAAFQVTTHILQVGDFVMLLSYMTQLQGPLNFFGTFYRMIQNNMINSERMLELFKEKPTVVDQPDAAELESCEGEIRFQDVEFAYDNRKPALQGLTFRCRPGTTTALVGESGGGKSTVFRLLFRFYNVQAGNISVDNHDVEDVTIDSVRRNIGVVPQDTVLFNETLMYNLKYARQSATDEEVFAACRAASIHDKILGFPDGYQTKVGERGLRLSGGEKQRVAIARTIIKDPRIILLDEATAALDTETEEHIQEALNELARGRTMLIIAHRLSTITMCDQILVLHEGKVAESGSHTELLSMKGRYASMWKKQVRAQRAAEEAKVLKDKADRLRRGSMDSNAFRKSGALLSPNPQSTHAQSGSSDEDDHHHGGSQQPQRPSATTLQRSRSTSLPKPIAEATDSASQEPQHSLSLSPGSAIPQAQIASVLGQSGASSLDATAQREALKSGAVRSPSPVEEEVHGRGSSGEGGNGADNSGKNVDK